LFDILKFKYHNIKILTRTGMEYEGVGTAAETPL